jgi:hypothetical protein
MEIEHFEDIEAWQPTPVCRCTGKRELARKVYRYMRSTRRPTVNYEPDNLSSYKQSIHIYFQNSWLKCLLLPFSAFMLIINSFIIKLQWKQIKWRAEKYRIRQVTNREL